MVADSSHLVNSILDLVRSHRSRTRVLIVAIHTMSTRENIKQRMGAALKLASHSAVFLIFHLWCSTAGLHAGSHSIWCCKEDYSRSVNSPLREL
jgi:hypothetical protein